VSRNIGVADRHNGDVVSGGVVDAPRRWLRVELIAGALGPIVAWALTFVVVAAWPVYDPIRQSISILVDAPLGWLQTLAFAVSGILGVAWALGLSQVLGATPRDRTVVQWLLLIQAAIAFGFAILPTDAIGAPTSTIGALHLLDFYAYAVTMPLTLLVLALVMRRDPRWSGAAASRTLVAAALALVGIALVPATLDGPLTPWLGLLERLFVAIPSVWQVAAAIVAPRVAETAVA
jgi:hypothetical protein